MDKPKTLKKAVARRSTYCGEWEWNVNAGAMGRGRIIGTACQWHNIDEANALKVLINRMLTKGYEVTIDKASKKFHAAQQLLNKQDPQSD